MRAFFPHLLHAVELTSFIDDTIFSPSISMQTCQSHHVLVQHARFNLQAESLLSRRQMDAIVCVDHLPNKHQPFLSQFDLNESYEISDQMIVPKVADTRKNGALGETWVTRLQGRRDRRRSVLHSTYCTTLRCSPLSAGDSLRIHIFPM